MSQPPNLDLLTQAMLQKRPEDARRTCAACSTASPRS